MVVVLLLLREMATLTDYFNHVSTEDYVAASFSTRERGKKTVKQPVERPRKHPLELSDGQAQADKENIQVAP